MKIIYELSVSIDRQIMIILNRWLVAADLWIVYLDLQARQGDEIESCDNCHRSCIYSFWSLLSVDLDGEIIITWKNAFVRVGVVW